MRVTAEKKLKTRERILARARRLFERKGFQTATTRDIATAAAIANGTLFNYFPSKEAIALSLIDKALEAAGDEFAESLHGDESLEEALFAQVAIGLRHLLPFRTYIVDVVESMLSPLTSSRACTEGENIREGQLATVRELIRKRQAATGESSAMTLHLYWALYLGVISFWANDASRHQEDTLALLDRSMRVFVATLPGSPNHKETIP